MRHLANVTGEAAVANMTDDALQAVIGLVRHNDRGLTAAGLVQTYEYGSDVAVVLRNDLAAFGLLAVAQHRYGDVCHSLVAAAAYSALLAARRLRGHASARWLLAAGLPAVACSLRTSALRCPMVTVLLALLGVLWLMCSTTCRADLPERWVSLPCTDPPQARGRDARGRGADAGARAAAGSRELPLAGRLRAGRRAGASAWPLRGASGLGES
ncbi:unnamed protein product [Prorocentrum cordatum]|uniref:Uncharacterized protein n=1 Tax=Prorocentrum cordatum TaxID=2364126 RepID=A0ABN9Y168_9DINO|nr:unnamed protein product [Polarella glacialis]